LQNDYCGESGKSNLSVIFKAGAASVAPRHKQMSIRDFGRLSGPAQSGATGSRLDVFPTDPFISGSDLGSELIPIAIEPWPSIEMERL
jgi:hypothetical protein